MSLTNDATGDGVSLPPQVVPAELGRLFAARALAMYNAAPRAFDLSRRDVIKHLAPPREAVPAPVVVRCDDDDATCLTCFAEHTDFILPVCGHKVLCVPCYDTWKETTRGNPTCPTCRAYMC